jgi:hypothetical protein
LWSAEQQAWLQAMGYSVYLEGGALDAPPPEVAAPAVVTIENVPAPVRSQPAPPPPREPAVQAPPAPSTSASRPAAGTARRSGGLRMPDRLQIALLRASGCDPNDPQTRALMDSWPLAELRANPAAKRALWPQLRALRRTQR